jgi:hypothetical protein
MRPSLIYFDASLLFVYSRKDLPVKNFKSDVLLVTGERGSFANAVEKLHASLDKSKATLLKIDRVGDVMLEAVSTIRLPSQNIP